MNPKVEYFRITPEAYVSLVEFLNNLPHGVVRGAIETLEAGSQAIFEAEPPADPPFDRTPPDPTLEEIDTVLRGIEKNSH